MAEIIEERRIGKASALQGGFDAWQQRGCPTEEKARALAGVGA